MESKARRYIAETQGQIGAVLILDVDYPRAQSAKVSLMVAEGAQCRWVQRGETFYSDHLADQPVGEIGFYLSDFLRSPVPPDFRRPSATELAAGISRSVALPSFSLVSHLTNILLAVAETLNSL